MNYEKYKNALEKAKVRYNEIKDTNCSEEKFLLELFPELAESEDERIRKALIEYFNEQCDMSDWNGVYGYQVVAWLEKQKSVRETVERCKNSWYNEGKIAGMAEGLTDDEKYQQGWHDALEKQVPEPNWCHHKVDLSDCSEEYRKAYYDGWNNCNMQHSQCKSELDDVLKCLINGMKFYYEDNKDATWGTDKWSMPVKHIIEVLEKQGKQKPTDKVEPKFHEGDWIIDKQGIVHQIEKVIENVTNNTFGYDLVGGGYFNEEVKSYRLWTIADAKDGNVLYSLDSNRPFIYKERNGYEQATAYCGLNIYGKFFVWNTKDCIITTDKYIPATKEQRELLFKKMKESGYQWDVEKKELKLLISNGGDFESNNSKQKPVNDTVETIVEVVSNTSILDMIEDKDAFTNPSAFENSLGRLLKLFEKLPKQDLLDGLKFYANVVKHDGEYVKPTEWSEDDERIVTALMEGFRYHQLFNPRFGEVPNAEIISWIKSLKERLS